MVLFWEFGMNLHFFVLDTASSSKACDPEMADANDVAPIVQPCLDYYDPKNPCTGTDITGAPKESQRKPQLRVFFGLPVTPIHAVQWVTMLLRRHTSAPRLVSVRGK